MPGECFLYDCQCLSVFTLDESVCGHTRGVFPAGLSVFVCVHSRSVSVRTWATRGVFPGGLSVFVLV